MANFFLTEDLNLNIARGLVKDAQHVHVLGYNPDIDTGTDPETVWTYGGVYPFASMTAANTIVLTSSNTSDTMNIKITGLDNDFKVITESITLNGTTPVSSTKKFLRINDAHTNGTGLNAGNITFRFANASGIVVDEIYLGYGQNTTGVYTIPDGMTGYLYAGDASINNNKEVTLVFRAKLNDDSIRVVHIAEVSTGSYRYDFPIPSQLPERSDLEVYVTNTLDNNTRVACNFDLVLVKNPVGS
jgi:hypothetical protein